MNRFRKLMKDEDGATAVLFVLVLPLLLSMLGYGSEIMVITGADRELQRTADVTALAAAAQTPVLDFGAIDFDSLGLVASSPVERLLGNALPGSPTVEAHGCPIGDAAAASSTLLVAFTDPDVGPPACGSGIVLTRETDAETVISELNAFLSAVPGIDPVLGDPTALVLLLLTQLGLPIDLLNLAPALAAPQVTATVSADVSTPFRQLISSSAGTRLTAEATARRRFKNVLLLPVLSACAPLPNDVPLTPAVVNLLEDSLGGSELAGLLNSLGLLDLGQLTGPLLNTLSPLLRPIVQALGPGGIINYFGGLPGVISILGVDAVLGTVRPGSTLPLNTQPGLVGGVGPGGAPDILDEVVGTSESLPGLLDGLLGDSGLVGALSDGAGCTINPNTLLLDPAADIAFDTLDAVIAAVGVLPIPGIDHLVKVLELLTADLRDLLDPGTEAPSPMDVLAAAAAADEDVLVVLVGSTQIPLLDLFAAPGEAVLDLLDSGTPVRTNDLVRGLADVSGTVAEARGAFRAELIR